MNRFVVLKEIYRHQQQAAHTITSNSPARCLQQAFTQQRRLMSSNQQGNEIATFPVAAAINSKLTTSFSPTHLEVINESHMHNVPPNSETHFKVIVVSEKFNDTKGLVQRHRMINSALSEELDGSVHALSIVAKTPEQWEKMIKEGKTVAPSPSCKGGDGSLPPKNDRT